MHTQAVVIGLVVLAVLVVGTFLGVTAMLLAPLIAAVALLGLFIWMARRRAQHRPPLE